MEKDGKVINVKTPQQHEKLKKQGFTHPAGKKSKTPLQKKVIQNYSRPKKSSGY